MDCNKIRELIIESISSDSVSFNEDILSHINNCSECKSYNEQIDLILNNYSSKTEIPDADRSKQKLYNIVKGESKYVYPRIALRIALLLIIILSSFFYINEYYREHGNDLIPNDIAREIVYEEIDALIESPGDLYLSIDLDNMTENEFALLLYDLERDLN